MAIKYPKIAVQAVVDMLNAQPEYLRADGKQAFRDDDFYVVWFCKTLQHYKALISTDTIDNAYFEVTYDGDKSEAYVDTYTKTSNKVMGFGIAL